MLKSNIKFTLGRFARDANAALNYPVWVFKGRRAPDNHLYKKQRIAKLAQKYGCKTFIETGTFYGQMVNYVKDRFDVTISVEIFEPFYNRNAAIFASEKNIHILLGDSAKNLSQAISLAQGRILFWLDGHYSGAGTGVGDKVSPIIEELRMISQLKQSDHCIVIDDRRLFTGEDGYPTIEETEVELRKINPAYKISHDLDSIVSVPK